MSRHPGTRECAVSRGHEDVAFSALLDDAEAVVWRVRIGDEQASVDRVHPQKSLTRTATPTALALSIPVEGDRKRPLRVGGVARDRPVATER